jgi:hypothetical protein
MPQPTLASHQKYALGEMHNGSILWGNVGSGKSRVGMAYYVKYESPKDLVVITTAKKRDSLDWETEAKDWNVWPQPPSLGHGLLTVDSWNNLKKYENESGKFFIFDEQRLVGKGTWVKAFLKIARNNRWIVLSATPGDTWMDYVPVFVANGFFANRSEFMRDHVVLSRFTKYPKVDRYIGVQKLVRLRSKILVKMPFENTIRWTNERVDFNDLVGKVTPRHTIRWPHDEQVGFDEKLLQIVTKDRWNPFENKPIENAGEMFYLARKVVNSDPERLIALDRVLEKRRKLITFYSFDYELAMLRQMREVVPFAEWNGHKHEEIPSTDRWIYAVQYTAGAEGWNCILTDTIVYWSLQYSFKLWEQSHGRIDRMDSPYLNLHYHTIRSDSWIDRAIWRALSEKRNFNEKEVEKDILTL